MATRPFVIFDLDGTLIHSAVLCADIANEMLAKYGSERRVTIADAVPFMATGGASLVAGLLGPDCSDVEQSLAEFRDLYASRRTPADSLFEGVREGLQQLRDHGLTLALCSNKPQHLCEKVLQELELAPMFSVVVGSTSRRRHKPDPEMLLAAMDELGAGIEDSVLVGDTEVDQAIAEAAGIPCLLLDHGYACPEWRQARTNRFSSFADLISHLVSDHSATRPDGASAR